MKKVLVIAPILSRSGYGVHSRFIVDALATRPDLYDLHIHPLNWGNSSWLLESTHKEKFYKFLINKKEMYKGAYDISVQITVPTEWQNAATINVGVTAGVETETIPQGWLQSANAMDKIIVTSQHTANGFKNTKYEVKATHNDEVLQLVGVKQPIEVIGYPVREIKPDDLSDDISLEDDFNFLSITQLAPRKNVESMIRWFVEEFREDNVGLVLKAHGNNNSTPDKFFSEKMLRGFIDTLGKKTCKIYHIHGSMTDEELHGLYKHPQIKAYTTTTHGEGFGLPMFESAYSGLPVIAPAYSGHQDFLCIETKTKAGRTKRQTYYEKVPVDIATVNANALMEGIITPEMKWGYPQEAKFKRAMRSVYENINIKQKTAARLRDYLRSTFTEEIQNAKVCESVWEAANNEKTEWTEKVDEVQVL
jgi:glycosyltransferase involved in cell wall biosynthesis